MVRIKYRYMLVNVLYPEPLDSSSKPPSRATVNPVSDLLELHRPSSDSFTPQLLARIVKDQVQYLYGDYGLGLVAGSLNVKYCSPATSTAILRCSRAHYRLVWSALSFITQIPRGSDEKQPRPCVMQVVRVSGTIKKAEEEAIRRARAAILRAEGESGKGTLDDLMNMLGEDEDPRSVGVVKENIDPDFAVVDEDSEGAIDSDEQDG